MPRFNITPIPKPRMTHADRRIPRPPVTRYWAFKDELNILAKQDGFELPDAFEVTFYLPMPKSWSKKKKAAMQGQPHQQVPDLDNLEKALLDSLLPGDDSGVWRKLSQKIWDYEGGIIIGAIEK